MHSRFPMSRGGAVMLVAGLAWSSTAAAQHSPALDRVSIWLGGYYASSDTTLRASTLDGRLAGEVNLEGDLGFRKRDGSPRLRASFLIGDSQGITLDYFRYRRERSATLSNSIDYNGNTYDAEARVKAKLGFDFGSIAYRWWIGQGNDVFGIGLGAGYYRVKASIRGGATVDGHHVETESSSAASAWAPQLQLGWRHAFNGRWRMYVNASGVKKNGGRLRGHIYHAALGVEWFPSTHFGISAEYDVDRIRLHQHRDNFNDDLDLRLDGPSVFATFRY